MTKDARVSGPLQRLLTALPLLFVAVIAGCRDAPAAEARPQAGADRAVQIRSVVITPEVLVRRIRALGTLQADETTQVSAEITGRITRINFEDGQRVEAGQTLFQLDDRIDRADLTRAEAQLALAKRSHARATELNGRGLLSTAELDQTLSALRVAEAEVAVARTRVEKARVPAPFSGFVGLRQVSPGAYVSPGEALVNLESVDRIKLDFRVPEAELAHLSVGLPATVSLDALPDKTFEAEVIALNPRASTESRSIELRARIDNRDGVLRPGLFARVQLELGRSEDALMAPEAAVFPRGEKNFVYRIDGEDRAELAEVVLGQREPGYVEIRDGIAANDEIVTGGIQRLSDGMTVQRQTATAAR